MAELCWYTQPRNSWWQWVIVGLAVGLGWLTEITHRSVKKQPAMAAWSLIQKKLFWGCWTLEESEGQGTAAGFKLEATVHPTAWTAHRGTINGGEIGASADWAVETSLEAYHLTAVKRGLNCLVSARPEGKFYLDPWDPIIQGDNWVLFCFVFLLSSSIWKVQN